MIDDPIVAEKHRVQEELYERSGGDLEKYFEILKQCMMEIEIKFHPDDKSEKNIIHKF